MKLTTNQLNALHTVATAPRTNLADLGRTGASLLKRGLVKKDWGKNDASGERVVLTTEGKAVFTANFC